MKTLTHNLGYPRIGARRELKKALESYWSGQSSEPELLRRASALRRERWLLQQAAGIDLIPSNDFSLYDHVLDTAVMVGAVPGHRRGPDGTVSLSAYFELARGTGGPAARALEMTKWFDTNYHYLVPELRLDQEFRPGSTKPLDEFSEAKTLGIDTVPVLLGPISFLKLAKVVGEGAGANPMRLLPAIVPVYESLLRRLADRGGRWVQIDEPVLALDLPAETLASFEPVYERLRAAAGPSRLMLAVYFGELGPNLPVALRLPVDGLHIDAVRARDELDRVAQGLRPEVLLSVGVVDGRNVWRNDLEGSLQLLNRARASLGPERVLVSPSCSLLHTPVSLKAEHGLDAELKSWLAFAEEKLAEVATLAGLLDGAGDEHALAENRASQASRRRSPRIHNPAVKARCEAVKPEQTRRSHAYPERARVQAAVYRLPVLPTTTIGSFPQTERVRSARARFKKGESTPAEYEAFLESEIQQCLRRQEELGLDVLVHGEFERNDMVEYFGEQLAGFAFTANGWVQSYGSRCVKPPIIFGDVSRPRPMTVRWARFAQGLTAKPVKGMLTGPLTVLQWSFVRDDQPRGLTARQLALAIRDEVMDLEAGGIGIIQVDEPALREGLPLRQAERSAYLQWAVEAFRLATAGVQDRTQIHTHMCYGEFQDIIEAIAGLDADVLSIETSRSRMELLRTSADFRYPNEIGPGVWDIHSPRLPSAEEMLQLLEAAMKVIPKERLWVNPDCGLKTRRWEEVLPALRNLVAAAAAARNSAPSEASEAGLIPAGIGGPRGGGSATQNSTLATNARSCSEGRRLRRITTARSR